MILGVILAGGRATRMGGGDKGLKQIGGEPMLTRVINRIGPQVERLIINANGDPDRFIDFDLPVIPDDLPDHPGPLAGILTAMDFATEMTSANLVLSVAADCPFLPHDLAPRLLALLKLHDTRISIAHSGGLAQPTIALWDVSLRHDLRKALADEGLRKIDAFTSRYASTSVDWPVTPYDPFFNANTPDDLALAESIASRYADA
jgi:molybdopterin-guanine dinucleotide biosynthesis protein A